MSIVVDTSALLAALWGEPGSERVAAELPGAIVSAVNLNELVGKLIDRGGSESQVAEVLAGLALQVEPHDETRARDAGALRRATRSSGLSLGDRSCLALGRELGLPVLTTDRAWAGLDLGVAVEVIR